MAKILLVEDDNNLREIYEARLQAEGYDIVAAQDGEAALVVAKKEKPDLIISDVMMPRISGFEMLDILRNTEGLKDVKVIMLTALGQAEDKTRADSLGADKYLVKSQVTLEDIVKAAAELLAGIGLAPAVAPAPVATPATVVTTAMPVAAPPAAVPAAMPTAAVTMPPTPVATTAPQTAPVAPAPAATANDPGQVMADAVKDLVSGTPASGDQPILAPAIPIAPAAPAATTLSPNGMPPASSASWADISTPPTQQPLTAQPIPPTLAAPSAPVVAPVVPPPQPPTPVAAAVQDDDSVAIAKKKIIQPLGPGAATPPTDINELLVKEGHTLDETPPPQAPTPTADHTSLPHPPGHVISPNPVSATGQPIDPNSISL